MPLIHEIQKELMQPDSNLAPILLKLRFLAAKLGSHPLAEWVKYEAEGYPSGVDIPDYRYLGVNYKGTFSGPSGSGIRNAPIPPFLIDKFAGSHWTNYQLRQSVAAIDKLVSSDKKGSGILTIDASNLILLLHGKIYDGYACNSVEGNVSVAQLKEVQHAVRNRILEITLEIEQSVSGSTDIDIGGTMENENNESGKVNQIFYQTIHGSMTNVSNTGSINNLHFDMRKGDQRSIQEYLVSSGIQKDDAAEFCDTLTREKPESKSEPFGTKAKLWISQNIKKAVDGTWAVGISTATDVLKKAALSYYGLSD